MKYFHENTKWGLRLIIIFMIVWGGVFSVDCRSAEMDHGPSHLIVFVSKNIRPYVEAVDGLRDRINELIDTDVEVIMLDRYSENARNSLVERVLKDEKADLLAAVGPEAAAFVWNEFASAPIPKIYSLILNPEKVIDDIVGATGISLNIPPADQLHDITRALPSVKRIGLFFDPAYNSEFFSKASEASFELDADVVPMIVSSRKDIPFLLEECWDSVDCIWLIPDQTVTSESIAQYIIKQAVLKKIPVIGYNRFFYDSGAAMAFVFDYKELGRQSAGLIADVLVNKASGLRTPDFRIWLNETVLEKLDLGIPDRISYPLMVGP